MAYKELHNVVFCGDEACRKVYRFDNSDGSDGIRSGDILPCGHKVVHILLDGNCTRESYEAARMLEWLYENDAIKPKPTTSLSSMAGRSRIA